MSLNMNYIDGVEILPQIYWRYHNKSENMHLLRWLVSSGIYLLRRNENIKNSFNIEI